MSVIHNPEKGSESEVINMFSQSECSQNIEFIHCQIGKYYELQRQGVLLGNEL